MNKVLFLALLLATMAGVAQGADRQFQIQFVDEFMRPVNMTTGVSINIYKAGTTSAISMYLDRGEQTSVTQPVTDNSVNTPLRYSDGYLRWWQDEATFKLNVTDGTSSRDFDNLTGNNVSVMWPSFLTALSSTSYGTTDDIDFTTGAWIIDGDTAGRLDLNPDSDAGIIWIGNTTNQADFKWFGGTDGTDYVEFNEGSSLMTMADIDLNLTLGAVANLDGSLDADVTSWDVLSSAGLSIDGAGTVMNVTNAADGSADDFTVALTGAQDSSLILSSTGTAADALQITASAGGIDIAASGAAGGEDIDIASTGSSVNVSATEAIADAVTIAASAGGVDITSAATFDIDITATGGRILGVASEAAADQFKIDATGTVAGNAINLETTDGGVLINADGAANGDIQLNAADDLSLTAAGLVNISGSLVLAGIQDIAAGGTTTVVTLTNQVITVGADAGGDIVTIPNGTAGQILFLVCEDATGLVTITPTTFNGGTSITMDAVGESVTLVYNTGLGWAIVGTHAATVI